MKTVTSCDHGDCVGGRVREVRPASETARGHDSRDSGGSGTAVVVPDSGRDP